MTMRENQRTGFRRQSLLLALAILFVPGTVRIAAFQLPKCSSTLSSGSRSRDSIDIDIVAHAREKRRVFPRHQRSTQLQSALLPSIVTKSLSNVIISPSFRNPLILGSTAAVVVIAYTYRNRHNFYPGSIPDPAYSEPLPDGSLGCPLLGNLSFFAKIGDAKTGPGKFHRWQAVRSGNPYIFKYSLLGSPTVIVNGMKNVKKVFNQEFKTINTKTLSKKFAQLLGKEGILFCNDATKHQFLRRLVGQSMTPEAVDDAIPALVESANMQIDRLSLETPVEMEEVLTSFTLDVAWRQILG
eukprot:CAMPEP_0183715562 /NCGR_PEP_ID=MMETSP0737-20130205/9719_1 /TAXON_ID=385413 /ORGANISM="Thalassiosira miniscula, Strain CCMP1093" /LENGTH=297 /DNA_ID=CAMNT_0025944663 /DNA_START=125 /DNA_END=1014 /DNA_ORIENTATION=-